MTGFRGVASVTPSLHIPSNKFTAIYLNIFLIIIPNLYRAFYSVPKKNSKKPLFLGVSTISEFGKTYILQIGFINDVFFWFSINNGKPHVSMLTMTFTKSRVL